MGYFVAVADDDDGKIDDVAVSNASLSLSLSLSITGILTICNVGVKGQLGRNVGR